MGLRSVVGSSSAERAVHGRDMSAELRGEDDHGPSNPARPAMAASGDGAAARNNEDTDGGGNAIRLTFTATPGEVRAALAQVTGALQEALFPDEIGALEIVLAEVLNNVAEHAYAGTSPGRVELSVAAETARIRCRVCDHGVELPGILVSAPVPDTGPGFDPGELQEGGYGWHLIHALTSALSYERRGSLNTLELELPRTGGGRG